MRNESVETTRVMDDPEADERLQGEMPGFQDLLDAYRRLREELAELRSDHEEILAELRRVLDAVGGHGPRMQERPVAEAVSEPEPDDEPSGPRVGLFVDVQSVFYNARNFYGRKMDFKRLIEVTTKDRHIAAAIAYVVQSPDVDQTNFITMLQHNGYTVRHKTPQRHGEGPAGGESPMVLDVLSHLSDLDVAVFVGGDGDILRLPERAQSAGVSAELYAFSQNVPPEAADVADEFTAIDEDLLLEQEYTPRRTFHDAGKGSPAGTYPSGRRQTRTSSPPRPHRSYWSEQPGSRGNWRGGDA